ncbi:MAG: DoxX family protein [Actinobacteria bacterium]|nr:DoxX family protein [Actinomycetota bacterium]
MRRPSPAFRSARGLLGSRSSLGLLVLRGVLGGLFVGHGTQKLFGWFEGPGLRGTGEEFDAIGLRPGRPQATTAGISETLGGALTVAGWLTPVGSALITAVMTQAIRSVHAGKGPWFTDEGWEYNAVIIAAMFAITDLGPGSWSIDHARGKERSGPLWATAALGVGAAAPIVITRSLFFVAAAAGLPV